MFLESGLRDPPQPFVDDSLSTAVPLFPNSTPAIQKPALGLATMLVGMVGVAYFGSFRGIFVFDDLSAIVDNPTIRDLVRLQDVFAIGGAHGATVDGRPLLNFTLAVNYAISGLDPWSYHAVNLAIHILATLALWGVLSRTFSLPGFFSSASRASLLSFAAAALWGLHPLHTTAVTYVVQRAESLMGLCFISTLYFFIRAVSSPRPVKWNVAAVATCFAGMACKEVMMSAPMILALYDRIFRAGSWRETWRLRGRLHLTLLSPWLLLAFLVATSDDRGGTAGFSAALGWWPYLLTQCGALVRYLSLAVWPQELVFDYGSPIETQFAVAAVPGSIVVILLGMTIWALRHKPSLGFLGAWFFLVLAPTSSVVPIATQTMAEHRMYLPLAAITTGLVLVLYRLVAQRAVALSLIAAVSFGALTVDRNRIYRSETALWSDTVSKRPDNARAHTNLGMSLLEAGRIPEALARFETAVRIDPNNGVAQLNFSEALRRGGRFAEALAAAETALRLEPNSINARVNLGHALAAAEQPEAAITHFEQALRTQPTARDLHLAIAAALLKVGEANRASIHLETALDLDRNDATAWVELARANLHRGEHIAAERAAARALQLKPGFPEAWFIRGNLAAAQRDFPGALRFFHRAVELAPGYIAARNNVANVLLLTGQVDAAIVEYRALLAENPDDRSVRENLERALELQRRAPRGPLR